MHRWRGCTDSSSREPTQRPPSPRSVGPRLSALAALAFAARFLPRAWSARGPVLLAAWAGVAARALAGRAGTLPAVSALVAATVVILAMAALYRLALRERGADAPGGLAAAV